jgi:hypothetical protein
MSGVRSVPIKLFLQALCLSEERNEVSTATAKLGWFMLKGMSDKKEGGCSECEKF